MNRDSRNPCTDWVLPQLNDQSRTEKENENMKAGNPLQQIPSVEEYKAALVSIKREISKQQIEMLLAHFTAPGRTITNTQLAEVVKYKNFNAANLKYGALSHLLGDKLGFRPSIEENGSPIWTFVIADGKRDEGEGGKWQWTMHPELAQALEELGWSPRLRKNPPWTRDELILALDLYFRLNPAKTSAEHPEIVALSELLNNLPIHPKNDVDEKFRNPNGVYMKLCNFLRFDPDYKGKGLSAGSKLEEEIWNDFAHDREKLEKVCNAIKNNYLELSFPRSEDQGTKILDPDQEFPEGRILSRVHFLRERNRTVVDKKKKQALKQNGRLECEACGFDFAIKYGYLGEGFAECHHNKPLSELDAKASTRISDLSILCANCHRMVHRAKPWLTVEQLSQMLNP
jgi:5-methylcytosine-specific restriction protein A